MTDGERWYIVGTPKGNTFDLIWSEADGWQVLRTIGYPFASRADAESAFRCRAEPEPTDTIVDSRTFDAILSMAQAQQAMEGHV